MVAAGKGLDPFCPYRAKRDALLSYWFLCGTFYQYRAVAGKSQGAGAWTNFIQLIFCICPGAGDYTGATEGRK